MWGEKNPKPPDLVLCISTLNELAISLSDIVDLNIGVNKGYRSKAPPSCNFLHSGQLPSLGVLKSVEKRKN